MRTFLEISNLSFYEVLFKTPTLVTYALLNLEVYATPPTSCLQGGRSVRRPAGPPEPGEEHRQPGEEHVGQPARHLGRQQAQAQEASGQACNLE